MIRLINEKIIGWLKSIFKGASMSFEFRSFGEKEIAEVEKNIDLKIQARTDGKNNLPREGSRTFSNCENEAITKVDSIRNEDIKKAAAYLDPKKKIITDTQAELDQTFFYIEQFKNDIKRTLNTAVGKLSNLKNEFTIEDNHVRTFKLENKLSREPKPLTTLGIVIGMLVIAILFYIELEVNSNLLAPAMISGKAEGLAIAGAVAGLNVLVSFFVGYIALKHFHHVELKKRVMAKIGLFVYAIFIIYINWSMGAYRSIYEATGVNLTDVLTGVATAEAVSGNATFPWTVTLTFTSLILVFVGIGFALLSLVDGYFFDDRYPGFGRVGKERKEKQKEINRIREHISTEINNKFKNELRSVREKQNKLTQTTLAKWANACTEIESVFEKYRRFAKELNEGLDHIIGEYRDVNGMFRNKAEPDYWKDDKGKVKTRYYNLSEEKMSAEKVFLDFVDLHLTRDEIGKRRKIYQDNIADNANKYISEINNSQKEVEGEIKNIREKYNVHATS